MSHVFRLIQADDLDAWQRALLALCLPSALDQSDVVEPPVVVVPNRAAGDQWRATLEQRVLVEGWTPPVSLQRALDHLVATDARSAVVLPRLVTRDQLYDLWHRRARLSTPRLPMLSREVLMGAAARDAARSHRPPFLLRPGLIAEMLRFHGDVQRLGHDPCDWLADAASRLGDEAATDRGAERLLQQTHFLRDAFGRYAKRLAQLGAVDEHGVRAALRRATSEWSPRHVIVTVADHHADPAGLWPADLAMLAEARGLVRVDVIATSRVAEGLFPRLGRAWSGVREVRISRQRPVTTQLEVTSPERRVIVCRDRDEEVLAYARRVKAAWAGDPAKSALVFRRPLPYLYAAQWALDAAGIPYQSSGTLPLAAEPWAASLDLLMDVVLSGFTRASLVSLLRSPHVVVLLPDGRPVGPADIAAFDRWLATRRYLGTLSQYDVLLALPPAAPRPDGAGTTGRRAAEWRRDESGRAVAAAMRPLLALLAPLLTPGPGAVHVAALRAAWTACARPPSDDDVEAGRTRRTRAAVDLVLEQLGEALAQHDSAAVPPRDTCILVRRWIEEQTFALPRDERGVHLLDADAARYGVFAHMRVVGLLEGEWPEPTARDIFYPAFMLERLGWAEERTRTGALRARLADLLTLPEAAVGVSLPELDQDAVVRPSSLLDELQAFDGDRLLPLPDTERHLPVTREDALLATPAVPDALVLSAAARDWAGWRLSRPVRDGVGRTAPAAGERYSVTAVETYLQCPFQYFAGKVLGLQEEIDDEPGLPARDAGLLLHQILHDAYLAWAQEGRVGIRTDDLPHAREVFARVTERALTSLSPADRVVERVRLFGSAVSTGVLEKALRTEVEQFGDVAARRLEHDIDADVLLPVGDGTRTVHLRGRIDRVDVTTSGDVRVIDYKSGRRPAQSLQPGVYALAVQQQEQAAGRRVDIAASGYVAFREDVPWVAAVRHAGDAADTARDFTAAVTDIEAGLFPVRPQNEFRCQFCDYASVCRKDYVGA
jgi:hypothetical protein